MNVEMKYLLLKKITRTTLGFFLFAYLLSGCSLSMNVENLAGEVDGEVLTKVTAKELSAGSQQKVKTSGQYTVQASVNYLQGSLETTTVQGYKVRSTVQSNIFADNK